MVLPFILERFAGFPSVLVLSAVFLLFLSESTSEEITGVLPCCLASTGIFFWVLFAFRQAVQLRIPAGSEKIQVCRRYRGAVQTFPGSPFLSIYSSASAVPSPAASTIWALAFSSLMSHWGTFAPISTAFSKMLPSSVIMYHASTRGRIIPGH